MRSRTHLTNALFVLVITLLLGGSAVLVSAARPYPGDFPRLYVLFATNDPVTASRPETLQEICTSYDAVEVMLDADQWPVATGGTVSGYFQDCALPVLFYTPAYYVWSDPSWQERRPRAFELRDIAWNTNGYLRDPEGNQIRPWPGQPLTSFYDPDFRREYAAWLRDLDRPLRLDVADGNFVYNGHRVDFDSNGISDFFEHGAAWIDNAQVGNFVGLLQGLRHPVWGNASWQPAGVGQKSKFEPGMDGYMVEDFPLVGFRDPELGWQPSKTRLVAWHLREALRRGKPTVFVPPADVSGDRYWSQYLGGRAGQRLSLAAALLTDGYLGLRSPISPDWCDECGINDGATSRAPGAGDWLGTPLGPAIETDGVWSRGFEHGAVWLNATDGAKVVSAPCNVYRQVKGWYDPAYNRGGCWDGKLGPYDARVVWSLKPAPTATPTQSPTPTPTPTPTPGPEPATCTFEVPQGSTVIIISSSGDVSHFRCGP